MGLMHSMLHVLSTPGIIYAPAEALDALPEWMPPWFLSKIAAWYRSDQGIVLASDPVVNGNFTVDASWTKHTWTIPGDGAAHHPPVVADAIEQACLVIGQTVDVTFRLLNLHAGTVTPMAGTTAGTPRGAPGTYTETLVVAGNTSLGFAATANCDAQITGVTVQPHHIQRWKNLWCVGAEDFVMATAADQMLYVPGGAPSGKPCLRSNGTGQHLKTAPFTLDQPCVLLVSAKWTRLAGESDLIDGHDTDHAVIRNPAGQVYFELNLPAGPHVNFANATPQVFEGFYSGLNSAGALNFGARTIGNAGGSHAGGLTLAADGNGGQHFAMGDYYEVIALRIDYSSEEHSRTKRYMNNYAGI